MGFHGEMPERVLVLASASPARLDLLRAAGLDPQVQVSEVDESGVDEGSPSATALELARRKATVVAGSRTDGALVLGCDSVLDLDGHPEGKPGSAAETVERWHRMRGRSARLVTGHHLVDCTSGRSAEEVVSTLVRFGSPSDEEIAAYARTPEPLRVAGAFTLLGRSGPFIDGIDGDPGNVLGVSLPAVRRLLDELGVAITDLWT